MVALCLDEEDGQNYHADDIREAKLLVDEMDDHGEFNCCYDLINKIIYYYVIINRLRGPGGSSSKFSRNLFYSCF